MDKSEILEYLDQQDVLILNTNGIDGTPVSRAMINIRSPKIAPHLDGKFADDDRILFLTDRSSEKMEQILANPACSVYAYDHRSYTGLLLTGMIREETDADIKDSLWDDSWEIYYPEGRYGGQFVLLEFEPRGYKYYEGFEVAKGNVRPR